MVRTWWQADPREDLCVLCGHEITTWPLAKVDPLEPWHLSCYLELVAAHWDLQAQEPRGRSTPGSSADSTPSPQESPTSSGADEPTWKVEKVNVMSLVTDWCLETKEEIVSTRAPSEEVSLRIPVSLMAKLAHYPQEMNIAEEALEIVYELLNTGVAFPALPEGDVPIRPRRDHRGLA